MKRNLISLGQLIAINYKEFVREPGILFWALVFPVMMAWVLGIAFSKKAELIQHVAYVKSNSQSHASLSEFLESSQVTYQKGGAVRLYEKSIETKMGTLSFHLISASMDSAVLMLKRGQISLILLDTGDSLNYYFDPQGTDARFNYVVLSAAINHERVI
jgi:ABC-2 type transport system permease protein